MAFSNAFRALNAASSPDNTTSTAGITQLPNILEAFIPGYSVISRFLLDTFNFDITLVVSASLLLFGLFTAAKYLWNHASEQFHRYFTSFINVESHDDIYDHVMDWLASRDVVKKSRSLQAQSSQQNAWDLEPDTEEGDMEIDTTELLNFSNYDAKIPPKFSPYFGVHRFWHRGKYFKFSRENKTMAFSGWGGTVMQNDETITISCYGRSTTPIKELINEARDTYLDKAKSKTVVRRPATKDKRSRGYGVWQKVATRPSRPMDTVILDHAQKDRVLSDMNEYLHPATPRWYANRGIPYRRGYLFAGPPGTGKSSLAWAIAGIFGLDIYCISLVEPTLTEEDLGIMFTSLPRRCVVLLEDIDSAGLVKRQEADAAAESKEQDTAAKIGAEITKAISSAQQQNNKGNKDNVGISLSGLLNAIDGVASHEGRILVMTSNFPDKLDDALIRPGRIDMRIDFTKATREQAIELFTRMYSPDTPAAKETPKVQSPKATSKSIPSEASLLAQRIIPKAAFALSASTLKPPAGLRPTAAGAALTPPPTPKDDAFATAASTSSSDARSVTSINLSINGRPKHMATVSPLNGDELKEIAKDFADRIPEDTFTPAGKSTPRPPLFSLLFPCSAPCSTVQPLPPLFNLLLPCSASCSLV